MTDVRLLAMTLRSVAAHAHVIAAMARRGPIADELLDEADGLYAAAAECAAEIDADEAPVDAPAASAEPVPCQHPEAGRIDFGVTGGVDDWQCGVCGYRTVPSEGEK